MFFRRQNDELEVLAPAKLNLFLEITDKRPDGFHELDMLMVPIALYDTLTFKLRRDDEITLSSGCVVGNEITLPPSSDNLVTRAVQLLRQRIESSGCSTTAGLDICLFKRIPAAAGLGGGSSDAAAALVAANYLWQAGLSTAELSELALQIGSDVPFFLAGSPARCRGRGELLTPLNIPATLDVVLIKPRVGLATAEVFAEYAMHQGTSVDDRVTMDNILGACASGRAPEIGRWLHNRLVDSALRMQPELQQLQAELLALGLPGVQMTGSGSTFYLICRHTRQARNIAEKLSHRGYAAVFHTRTLSHRSLNIDPEQDSFPLEHPCVGLSP
ncbi:MAG: 4-(cytidine 5'-diphospho)-2-C-methyl-D-erythritol kinase [Planctomycetaceae bacterium]|jgi:4-diphosphocytidyl-2-C-methyl-D-erythritol kinase|nr:4-(cytidine 5'-diphospho)-2-C-methyl-D-erythritol kinase [Planctomycetaceae bacterium]